MLDKRDELIASLAKTMGLVSDAALARATDLKKRFPQQKLEQILESAGLITKEGRHKLAHAFNERVKAMQGKGDKKPSKPVSTEGAARSRAEGPANKVGRTSDSGKIVPTASDEALLNSLAGSASSSTVHHDPLATPPSEEALSTDSSIEEERILSEPTLMLPDEELKRPLAKTAPGKPAAMTEEEILAEPTLMVPDEDLITKPSPPSEDEILAEPTLLIPKDNLDLVPEPEPAAPSPELSVPDDLVAGGVPVQDASSKEPGVKKRTGRLDRREFERRSKLRMSFEGMTIGDYEIEGELSRGAFGVVLKVRPGTLARALAKERGFSGEILAMKVMLSGQDPEEQRRFADEMRTLINLQHHNIVRMFDSGGEHGLHYYTMELIQGVDSRTLVREQGGKLPVLYAMRIARDVASALDGVHRKGVFHRDLKPANVMIDRAAQPYRTVLIDFGLVAQQKGGKDEGLILGTPSYMPPEQAKPKGGFGEVNATSDIYSLGATFYFLMTGTAPFPGRDPREIIKRVCSEPAPDPVTLNPEIPKSIAALCMKCLAKRQFDRFDDAAALVKELDRELSSGQTKLKVRGFMRKIFGSGSSGKQQQQPPPPTG